MAPETEYSLKYVRDEIFYSICIRKQDVDFALKIIKLNSFDRGMRFKKNYNKICSSKTSSMIHETYEDSEGDSTPRNRFNTATVKVDMWGVGWRGSRSHLCSVASPLQSHKFIERYTDRFNEICSSQW